MVSLLYRTLIAVASLFAAISVLAAEMTLYEGPNFGGRSMTVRATIDNFDRTGFNDRASSILIHSGVWDVCVDAYFQGQCKRLGPGEYRNLGPIFNNSISSVRPVSAPMPGPGPAPAPGPGPAMGGNGSPSIQLFERRGFGGRSITLTTNVATSSALSSTTGPMRRS